MTTMDKRRIVVEVVVKDRSLRMGAVLLQDEILRIVRRS
jgi:hypothetical protein